MTPTATNAVVNSQLAQLVNIRNEDEQDAGVWVDESSAVYVPGVV